MTFTDTDLPRPADPGTAGCRTVIVLDTSVLIADTEAFYAFPDTEMVIPLTVIEELDGHKSRLDDVGRAARHALRTIEAWRVANNGDIQHPISLPNGSTLRVEPNGLKLDELTKHGLPTDKADNRIIAAALGQRTAASVPVTVVSNDAALRIKAAQVGLNAVEHRRTATLEPETRSGWRYIDADSDTIDALYQHQPAPAADVPDNEFCVFRAGSQSAMTRVLQEQALLIEHPQEVWGLRPRSKEQQFALDLLTDPTVGIVALDGPAGTGKTLVAVAAALEQTVEAHRYDKVAVYRPIIPVGKADLGFLPGDVNEKLDPWMAAIYDAVTALTDSQNGDDGTDVISELTHRNKLSMESVTYLRGRTLHRTFIIVDEAQNLEPTTLKTILTRVGEGSKIVFTGDTSQIDAPYLSVHNNALSILVDIFAGEQLFGHVRLTSCERSPIANLAAERL